MEEEQVSGNVFTEEGRLMQAEYAIKNVNKAGTIIGLLCTDGVILLGINSTETNSIEKIYQINSSAYCAVAGIFSDAMRLISHARLVSENIKETIGSEPSLSVLCDDIADYKQYYTHQQGARPFGVSFLYAGYTADDYHLYSTDPSGTVNTWRAKAFGKDEEAINSSLRSNIGDQTFDLKSGVNFLIGSYAKAKEMTEEIAKKMEILIFNSAGSRFLAVEEIKEIIRQELSLK